MNSPEQTPESRPARDRRVGTFTFGAVLVICGALMLVSMFFPSLDLTLALQLSPLILVCLGVEVLLASRSGGKIRYDWVGMVLCFVLVTAALVFFGIAWCLVYHPEAVIHYCGSAKAPVHCTGAFFFLVFPGKSGIMEKIPAAERKNPHV